VSVNARTSTNEGVSSCRDHADAPAARPWTCPRGSASPEPGRSHCGRVPGDSTSKVRKYLRPRVPLNSPRFPGMTAGQRRSDRPRPGGIGRGRGTLSPLEDPPQASEPAAV
jgi:hypothetical protein